MNLVKCLAVSVGGALLLCSCESLPPQLRELGPRLHALTCKSLPAGEERLHAVQQALADQGYDPGPLDGQMGHKTREALRQFQADEGLPATGTVDATTREALGFCKEGVAATATSAAAHPPTGNPRIQEAQRLLTERGYAPGPADGVIGSKTREALKHFQNDKGLPVSGRVDAGTLEALRSSARPAWEETQTAPENPPVTGAPSAPLPDPAATPPESTGDSAPPSPVSPMPAPPSGIMPPPPVSQTSAPSPEIAPPVSPAPTPSLEIVPPPTSPAPTPSPGFMPPPTSPAPAPSPGFMPPPVPPASTPPEIMDEWVPVGNPPEQGVTDRISR